MTVVPFVPSVYALTRDLLRAAEAHEGRPLTDHEAREVLRREVDALLAHWAAVGAWMSRLDRLYPARPVLSQIAVNNPSPERRAQLSAAMKAVWAAKRAASREFGQRAAWRTPAQKAYQSARQREAWAQRKAKEA